MTVNVLFLDDMNWRHQQFGRLVDRRGDDVLVWKAYTAAQAIELLDRVEFAQVFLDHDLCDDDAMVEVGAASVAPTGMAVVNHIVSMESPPGDVIVHSLNGPAREEMTKRLLDCGRIARVRSVPFSDLIARLQ